MSLHLRLTIVPSESTALPRAEWRSLEGTRPALMLGGEDCLYCGNCDFMIAMLVEARDHRLSRFHCPRCGATNQVPPLR